MQTTCSLHTDVFLYIDLYVLGDDGSISYDSFMPIKHICILIHISDAVKLSSKFFTERKMHCFFRGHSLLFVFHVCHTVLSVPCNLVVTYRERADLMSFLLVIFSCVFFATSRMVSWVSSAV